MKSRFALALVASLVPALAMAQGSTTATDSTKAHVTAHVAAYTPKISADSAKAIALATDKDAKFSSSHLVYAYNTHYYKVRVREGKKHEYVRVNAEDGSLFTVPAKPAKK